MSESRIPFRMMLAAAVLRSAAAGSDLPVHVGEFRQEVALHWQRQAGLSDPNVLDVRGEADLILVETTDGWSVWNGERWIRCQRPIYRASTTLPPGDIHQINRSPRSKRTAIASSAGLFESFQGGPWAKRAVNDGLGRMWAASDVRAVVYDAEDRLWFATLAGVAVRRADQTWKFFEGKDGLPFNDFTCAAAGSDGSVWFGTTRGAVRFQEGLWSYRQGKRWLPNDKVHAIYVDRDGSAWFATAGGVGCIARERMTLQQKAEFYENQIDAKLKRTDLGYVGSGRLRSAGDTRHISLSDSDNDGLWTAMYGASQCYAYAVTKSAHARKRADQAFKALRFLQTVAQGGIPSPPPGYVARSILPISAPDPNQGRMAFDHTRQQNDDRMWKVYQPRWPKSQDERWYWKSDTSSDELDGHYFFYALYFDLVAESADEKEPVRTVVRDLTDHLIKHDFVLQDHDGKPTRWANFRPRSLNSDYRWHQERGLNSLSMLSYLAVARHMTGDSRYEQAAKKLRDTHHYAINLMVPKMQRGPGSGNQSDDEMAFMSFYNLVKYTPDAELRRKYLGAFFGYWMLEQPERNPFFHFAYAALGRGQSIQGTFGETDLSPWGKWLEDSVATLKGFPLDRINWAHANSHRLDIVTLPRQQAMDYLGTNRPGRRGHRIDGKVLPVAERYFEHWNTDPWRLDYGGDGRTLGCGSVFLLPYYMGRYHGIISE